MPFKLDAADIRRRLAAAGLEAVGHTAYYLPLTSPIPELKEAALAYFRQCLEFFAGIGVALVNVHPFTKVPLYSRDWLARRQLEVLGELCDLARAAGVRLMLENVPPYFNQPADLKPFFDALPDLGFHLDVGHANLDVPLNITGKLLAEFRGRVVHVHLNDNMSGREDLHLPLGAGKINWPWVARMLKRYKYDGTITLEIFSPDRDYLLLSKAKWVKIWDEAGSNPPSLSSRT